MAGLFAFVLAGAAAAASTAAPPPQSESRGAAVRISATATVLRAETASESTPPGGLVRHVSRRSDGSAAIIFE